MKLIKFTTRDDMLRVSRAVATRKGCGKNPQDITRLWYRSLAEAFYIDDTEQVPTGGTELTGTARTTYEAANTPKAAS